jgi:hypothetical protein
LGQNLIESSAEKKKAEYPQGPEDEIKKRRIPGHKMLDQYKVFFTLAKSLFEQIIQPLSKVPQESIPKSKRYARLQVHDQN